VASIRPGTQTTIGGVITFGQSGTELSEDAVSAVRQIAEKIRGHMVVFMVKGHTSRDEEYALRDSKRDLSYERAEAVVRKLVEMGVSREGLRTQACRDYEPIREGAYSEQTRGANRRVEVIATEALVCEYRGGDPSTKRNYQINELGRRLEKQLNDRNITTPAHQPEAHAADHD